MRVLPPLYYFTFSVRLLSIVSSKLIEIFIKLAQSIKGGSQYLGSWGVEVGLRGDIFAP